MLNKLKGVFKSFQQHEVGYVVIGGIAVVLYGVPRATFDLDILIEATPENAQLEYGEFKTEVEDVSDYFSEDMVSFLLGCSFSFENAMLAGGLSIRNMEEDKNVSVYITNRKCTPDPLRFPGSLPTPRDICLFQI